MAVASAWPRTAVRSDAVEAPAASSCVRLSRSRPGRGGQRPAGAPARGAGRHLPGVEGERDLPEADRQLVVAGRLLGAKDRDPEQARRDPRRGRLGEHEAGVEPFGEIDETEDPGPVLIDGDGRAEAAGSCGLAHWVLLIAANGARSSGATGCGRSTVR